MNKEKKWFLDGNGNIPSGFDEKGKFDPNKYYPNIEYKIKGKVFNLKSNPDKLLEDPFDLNNLRFINPDDVKNALSGIEKLVKINNKEIICIIGTGGTISMTLQDGKLKPGLNTSELLEFAGGGLSKRFGISSFELTTPIDSSQMEIDYIADIIIAMSYFFKELSDNGKHRFCGFLVTHGTDTINQSATYANVMLGANYPFSVGFVAAQKTIEDRFTDVGINFSLGLEMLSELKKLKKITIFVTAGGTGGGAFIPASTLKISDTNVNAFDSPGKNKLMDVSNFLSNGIDTHFIEENEKQKKISDIFQPIILRGYVPISTITAKIGINPEALYEYVKASKDLAIILVTYGGFTFSPKQVDAIVKAAKKNKIALFAMNPFPTGSTNHLYEEALYLNESGITSIDCLEHSAYAKIKWGQAVWGNNIEKIKMFLIGNNFMGEQHYDWESPFKASKECIKKLGFKVRKIGQPSDSFKKVKNKKSYHIGYK